MAYANFIPSLWKAEILRSLKNKCVFADGVWSTTEKGKGTVQNKGESVTFVGIGSPTITEGTKADRNTNLSDAETIEDTSLIMPINQYATFNYKVNDIDKAQAQGDVLAAINDERDNKIKNVIDKYIAKLASAHDARLYNSTAVQLTKSNIMETLDGALTKLFENGVDRDTYVEAILPPYAYMLLKQAYQNLDTDNSLILKNGRVGKYGNIVIKMSNNVYNDGTNDLIQIRTTRSIGYKLAKIHVEPYRPEKSFSDAIKGYVLYDAMIIRPQELIIVKAHA